MLVNLIKFESREKEIKKRYKHQKVRQIKRNKALIFSHKIIEKKGGISKSVK